MKFFKFVALYAMLCILGGIAFAGAVDGATNHEDTVMQGKTDVYRFRFSGGGKATVRAKARGDIDLYVYDTHDNLIEKDVEGNDVSVCTWMPKATDQFTVKVVNNEKRDVDYKLETN